jgi:hypothetical protein
VFSHTLASGGGDVDARAPKRHGASLEIARYDRGALCLAHGVNQGSVAASGGWSWVRLETWIPKFGRPLGGEGSGGQRAVEASGGYPRMLPLCW